MKCVAFSCLLFALLAVSRGEERQNHHHGGIPDDADLPENFEARIRQFSELLAKGGHLGDSSPPELADALKELLPEDPDLREPALARLFMKLMGEDHPDDHPEDHPRDAMYWEGQKEGEGEGRGPGASFGRHHFSQQDRRFPGPR